MGRQLFNFQTIARFFKIGFLLGWLSLSPAGAAQTIAVPVADYWRLVNDTSRLVNGLLQNNPPDAHEQLLALSGRWQAVHFILLDKETIPFDPDRMVSLLQADPPDLLALSEQLDVLQAIRTEWPLATFDSRSGEEAETVLADILARPEFNWQPQEPSFFQQLWEKFLAWTARLMVNAGTAIWIRYLAVAVGGLFLAFVLIYIGRGLFASFTSESRSGRDNDGDDHNLTADLALQKAQELSKGGDFRSAIRYLYLSTLLLLDERGVLRYERWRTNREYLRMVANRPELSTTLASVVDLFDRTWYGFETVDQATFERYEQQVLVLKHQK